MITNNKNIISSELIALIAFLSILFASCEKVIELNETDPTRELVINSVFNNSDTLFLNIYRTSNILEPDTACPIYDAAISLFINDIQVSSIINNGNGEYFTDEVSLNPGDLCRIEVDVDGFTSVSASTEFPEATTLGEYEITTKTYVDYDEVFIVPALSMKIDDPGNTKNYYELEIVGHGWEYYSFWQGDGNHWEEVIFDSAYTAKSLYVGSEDPALTEHDTWYGNSILFDDQLFDGKEYNLNFYIEPDWNHTRKNDSIFVTLHTITEELFLYKNSYRMHLEAKDNPFAQPVQVYSNIENGFGVLGAYASYTTKIIDIPEY